ncbi:alpha/beta fold hydrolase [Kitasatospora sp. HPMI-4]|uniref:alpha/beta fold hydrolase n=1 Tax=Kitasatospora sp. HPMI-4 TaxID=3448443 RepID=UPI003F1B2595
MSSTQQPDTRFLDVPGGRIAFDDSGAATGGATVVLLPGILESRTLYRFLRPLLTAAGHRVISMDLRGFGESSIAWDDYSPDAVAQDVLALLDHLDIARAVLVGHSYTCATVVKAAAAAPERVAGVAVTAAFLEHSPNALQRALMKALAPLVLTFPGVWGSAQRYYYPSRRPADFENHRARLVAALRTPGRKAATRGQLTGDSIALGAAATVRCPALVIMGGKDVDFPDPAALADRQAAALKGRKVMIGGAGHYPMAEFPEATADALLPFLHEVA